MTTLPTFGGLGPAHWALLLLFDGLILCLFIRMILSWLPMLPESNRFVRFFINITGPIYDPIVRIMPRMAIGMFDMGATIAFFFVWWGLGVIQFLAFTALPLTW